MASRTLTLTTRLAASADVVWQTLQSPATLVHVARPLARFPDLEGRTTAWREGETVSTRVLLLGVLPFSRHRLTVESVDHAERRLQSDEAGGPIRSWRHLISVDPEGEDSCRYTDVVEIDAGALTPAVAVVAGGFYRWRQRRWRALARHGLRPRD
jgi:hypothetical protein